MPVLGAFNPPTAVVELNSGTCEKGITLTADLLEAFWDSDRGGGLGQGDIWTATRAFPTAMWGTPVDALALSTSSDEDTPRVSSDGLVMYLANSSSGGNEIYRATRATRQSAWSVPMLVPVLSTPSDDFGPWVSADETRAVYESSQNPGGLWTSSRSNTAQPWAAPTPLAEIPFHGGGPWLDVTQRIMYFADAPSSGLYVATRASPAELWGTPTFVSELGAQSFDAWLSPDLATIFYIDNCRIMTASR